MKIHAGLSYSNLQGSYGVPCIISGVTMSDDKLRYLNLMDNESFGRLLRRPSNAQDEHAKYEQILHYLDNMVTISIGRPVDCISDVSDMYIEALNSLTNDNFPLLKHDLVISYHKILKIPGFTFEDIGKAAKDKFLHVGHIAESGDGENGYPVKIASFLAKAEYSLRRAKKCEFLMKRIALNPSNSVYFYKISYQREHPDDFDDNFVSFPELLLRKNGNSPYRQALKVDKSLLNFSPLAKCCKGVRENGRLKPCISSSKESPYGSLVFGGERCQACKKMSKHAECLIDKPSCNGLEVACKNTNFAGEICNGEFGLYVTRYCNVLKVGKALLCNLISRLLDQGVNSALLLYPILNISRVYKIEHLLKDYLQNHIDEVSHFISGVTLASPKSASKVQDFLTNWNRDDIELLNHTSQIIQKSDLIVDGEKVEFTLLEKKINTFLANYRRPPYSEVNEILFPPSKVHGKIVGYRGSVIFMEDKKAVDMKRYQGYVIMGGVRDVK